MLDTIVEMLNREPFHPFRIVLTNGDRYDVLNPHLLAIGESQLFYAYPRSDRFAFLRLNQIAAVETIQAAA
jgi:hypothetical protein